MIAFISPSRGDRPSSLVGYLFGPGRHNEHTDPHVVAAAELLGLPDGHRFTDESHIVGLGLEMDAHRVAMDIPVPAVGHVWHCSISIPASDGRLGDAGWAQVARAAVEELGFTERPGQEPCRWLAVHHGQSVAGNDHIHLMVNLIREDGSAASLSNDRRIMSRLCGDFERRFGLEVVEGRSAGGLPGLTRAELENAARGGWPEPLRWWLARVVRACAVAAEGEADFVGLLRGQGLDVRPRVTGGDSVVGYSVTVETGVRDEPAVDPPRFGGGSLGRDLTLPRLRVRWPHGDGPLTRALWDGTEHAGTPAGAVGGHAVYTPLARAAERLAAASGDLEPWMATVWETAGVVAAWSVRTEGRRAGLVGAAADVLARCAQVRSGARADGGGPGIGLGGVARALLTGPAVHGDPELLEGVAGLMEAIRGAHLAGGRPGQAAALGDAVRDLRSGLGGTAAAP